MKHFKSDTDTVSKRKRLAISALSISAVFMLLVTVMSVKTNIDDNIETDKSANSDLPVSLTDNTIVETTTNVKNNVATNDSASETDLKETIYTENDVLIISKAVWCEAKCVDSDMEKSAVAWCILNRVDSPNYPDTIEEVILQDNQFQAYDGNAPVDSDIKFLVEDVLQRWTKEKQGEINVGRILPSSYLYFVGDGEHNEFVKDYLGTDYWDWSLPNPYTS